MKSINFQKLEHIFLVVIIVFGLFLYLHKLGTIPPGLYLDEAGTGYNTYSLLLTGKDEYGQIYPTAIRLFGSYSPPLYIFLSIPLMSIFGLSIFSTRLLSVICGVLSIPIIFLIIKEMKIIKSTYTALLSSLFFTITPWTIFYARMGYEQYLAFLFFSLYVLLLLKSLKKPKLFALTIPIMSLTMYMDYAQRYLTPLFALGIIMLAGNKVFSKKNIKYLLIGLVIALIIQIPNLLILRTPAFYTKTDHFYSEVIRDQSAKIRYFPKSISSSLAFIREFGSKMTTYYSPRSLFFLPDSDPQRSMPDLSIFFPWMVVPYIVGIYYLWKKRKLFSAKLIFLLLLITPITGALTHEPFHVQRTLALLLPLTLIIAIGFDKLIEINKTKILLPVVITLFLGSLVLLWRSYFVLLPQERALVWGYGYPRLAKIVNENPSKTYVIFQPEKPKPQEIAYTQLAFYLKLPPEELHLNYGDSITSNYYYNTEVVFDHKFRNIEVKPAEWGETDWRDIIIVGDTVQISDPEVLLHNLTQVFEIKGPNNEIVYRGFQTNPKNK